MKICHTLKERMLSSSPKNYTYYFGTDNTGEVVFVYNSSGARVLKKAELQGGISHTTYIRGNGDYPLFEVNEAGLSTFYIYSPTGLICQIKNDNEYYIIKDHLGSTRKVVNSDGVVVFSYNYDAFANLMNSEISEEVIYQYTG